MEAHPGPVVVASAIKLDESMRARLGALLGSDFVVLDVRVAPESANVVITPRVSDLALGQFRLMFPTARIVVSEVFDLDSGLDHRGPIHDALSADVDGYVLANSLDGLGVEIAKQAGLQLSGSTGRTPLQLQSAAPSPPAATASAQQGAGRTIWWINGPFGVGKTALAAALARLDRRVFDPELIGTLVRRLIPEPVRDYQSLRPWRALVAETAIQLVEHYDCDLVCPISLLNREWAGEIFAGVSLAGIGQRHLVLHADRAELERRIREDESESEAAPWRLDSIDRYEAARAWLDAGAEIVDTTLLSPADVADRVDSLMTARG